MLCLKNSALSGLCIHSPTIYSTWPWRCKPAIGPSFDFFFFSLSSLTCSLRCFVLWGKNSLAKFFHSLPSNSELRCGYTLCLSSCFEKFSIEICGQRVHTVQLQQEVARIQPCPWPSGMVTCNNAITAPTV